MKLEAGIIIYESCLKASSIFNSIMDEIENIDDEDERKLFRRGIAEVSGVMFTEIMLPIEQRFPEIEKR
jgi:hypothetical protein